MSRTDGPSLRGAGGREGARTSCVTVHIWRPGGNKGEGEGEAVGRKGGSPLSPVLRLKGAAPSSLVPPLFSFPQSLGAWSDQEWELRVPALFWAPQHKEQALLFSTLNKIPPLNLPCTCIFCSSFSEKTNTLWSDSVSLRTTCLSLAPGLRSLCSGLSL